MNQLNESNLDITEIPLIEGYSPVFIPLNENVTPDAPTTETPFDESENLSWAEYWNKIADAFDACTFQARQTAKGYGCDFTSDAEDARKLWDALETVREALPLMVKEFDEEVEHSLQWHRNFIEKILSLKRKESAG